MKKLTYNLLAIFMVITSNIFVQEFYPLNLISLITDENLPENALIKMNDYQLIEKGFSWENDSLYVNKNSVEMVTFSASKKQNIVEVRVDYYSTASDLTRFMNRAGKSGLDKINENLFEKRFPNIVYRIKIKRNMILKDKKYTLLSFVFKNSSTAKTDEKKPVYFRTDHSYPLQNTAWYFDCELNDDKKNKDEYFANMKFAKDKKYAHKVEFLDDANFKVTLASKQTFTGTYVNGGYGNNQRPSLNFDLTIPKAKKGYIQPVSVGGIPSYSSEIKRAKNTLPYYKYFFYRGYEYKFEQNDLLLTGRLYENMPTTGPAPSLKATKD